MIFGMSEWQKITTHQENLMVPESFWSEDPREGYFYLLLMIPKNIGGNLKLYLRYGRNDEVREVYWSTLGPNQNGGYVVDIYNEDGDKVDVGLPLPTNQVDHTTYQLMCVTLP